MSGSRVLSALALIAALLLSTAPAARAQSAADSVLIVQLIERQLDAFRRDDGAGAFALASPNIQHRFETPEAFMRMVVEGYAPVYRPRSVKFLDLIDRGGTIIQRVMLEGPDGKVYVALYPMVLLEDGTWRIDGCYLMRAPGEGA